VFQGIATLSALIGAYRRWLALAWLVWGTAALILTALAIALWPPITERCVRLTALALQIVGTGSGFLALSSTRRLFGVRSFAANMRQWWQSRPRRNVTAELKGTAISMSGGTATLSAWANMGPELELAERLNALAANVEQLRKEAASSNLTHVASVAKLRGDMDARTRATDTALSDISRKLRESQTGGLWFGFAALIIITVGTILAGIAPDIGLTAP